MNLGPGRLKRPYSVLRKEIYATLRRLLLKTVVNQDFLVYFHSTPLGMLGLSFSSFADFDIMKGTVFIRIAMHASSFPWGLGFLHK